MSKMNYKRSQFSSFVPRTEHLSESERQERILSRLGNHRYYAAIAKHNREMKEGNHPTPSLQATDEQLIAVRKHKQKVKLRKDRLQLIKEMAELNKL
ncbi:MAG TPA: hypothetical protein VMV80_08060 [Anaerolineales bacterium]|nr:hypothetical protein [Anaerolineales bacterium]